MFFNHQANEPIGAWPVESLVETSRGLEAIGCAAPANRATRNLLVRLPAVLLAMLLSAHAGAQMPWVHGACVNVQQGPSATPQAAPSGAGIFVTSILVNNATAAYAARSGTSATLTT